ncbi:RNA polymerase sigma factor, partial [Nocardioides sp.]|uniref:RNA polymerase sigma factor n=1 Tax=Nocardioides sp. TaxID=35761 RepID=UPI002B2727F9
MFTGAEVLARSRRQPHLFAEIFDRHHGAIHAYVSRRAGHQVADDVLSEVFTAAFAQRASFASESGSALPWLYGIARNLTHRHFRTTASDMRVSGTWAGRYVDDHDAVIAGVDASREWHVVRDVLATLAADDRETLLLYAWEGLSYAEVADAVGVPVGTVRSRIHRARRALRGALDMNLEEAR